MNPIIFLDFDGVLSPFGERWPRYGLNCVFALKQIVDATGADSVISSGWRTNFVGADRCNFVLTYLLNTHGVCCNVIGMTPIIPESVHSGTGDNRTSEVLAWLAQNPQCTNWVALDDLDCKLDRFVRTNPSCGLTLSDADRAIAILGGKSQRAAA